MSFHSTSFKSCMSYTALRTFSKFFSSSWMPKVLITGKNWLMKYKVLKSRSIPLFSISPTIFSNDTEFISNCTQIY